MNYIIDLNLTLITIAVNGRVHKAATTLSNNNMIFELKLHLVYLGDTRVEIGYAKCRIDNLTYFCVYEKRPLPLVSIISPPPLIHLYFILYHSSIIALAQNMGMKLSMVNT